MNHREEAQPSKRWKWGVAGIFLSILFVAGSAFANPVLSSVASGTATVSQTSTTTTVQQTSGKAIIDWKSFNIQQNETTHFQQPTDGIALNRINPGQGASSIYGHLSATGQIILVNQAGIYFGPNAYVNVGGIMASTADISNQDFLSGNYNFNQASPYAGAIVNDGHIATLEHGFVVLAAPGVVNHGVIEAQMGHVVLASGATFTVSFQGNHLINFAISDPTQQAGRDKDGNILPDGVNNSGLITAEGGIIQMTARAAQGVLAHAINMQGVVQASNITKASDGGVNLTRPEIDLDGGNGDVVISGQMMANTAPASSGTSTAEGGVVSVVGDSIVIASTGSIEANGGQGGQVILLGGSDSDSTVTVAGKLSASSEGLGGKGGQVAVLSGNKVQLTSSAKVDVSGDMGGGTVNIGGSAQGAGPFPNAQSTTVDSGAVILADAFVDGSGGNVVVWSDNDTQFQGLISAKGGVYGGNGGYIETSSANLLDINGIQVNLTAPHGSIGTWLLDPQNVLIEDSGTNTPIDSNTSVIYTDSLETNLAYSNVDITTDATGSGNGDITVNSAIQWDAPTTLALSAYDNIFVNADISGLNKGSGLNLTANLGKVGGAIQLQNVAMTAGSLILNADVILRQAAALIASNGNVNINGGVSGGYNLTVGGTGQGSAITGAITGADTAITSAGPGTLTISGAGNTYGGGTTVNGGTLAVSSSLGTGSVTVNANSTLLLENVSLANPMYIQGSGAPGSLGALVAANGTSDTVNGPVTLTGATTMGVGDGASLVFGTAGTINGAYNLSFVGTGALTLDGRIGGITPLASLSIDPALSAKLGADVSTIGAQSYGGPLEIINPQVLASVMDAPDSIVTLTSAQNNITFSGPVDADATAGGAGLAVFGKQIEFDGAVGGVAALSSLAATGDNIILQSVSTGSGGQTYTGIGASSTLSLDGSYLSSGGSFISSDETVSLAGSTLIDTTNKGENPQGGDIHFGVVNSGSNALTLNGGTGGMVSGGAFKGGGNLTIQNSGSTSFSGAVDAGTITVMNTSSSVAFNNTIRADNFDTSPQGYAILIDGGGSQVLNPVVFYNTGGLTLGSTGSSSLNFLGGITSTGGSVTVGGDVYAPLVWLDSGVGETIISGGIYSPGGKVVLLGNTIDLTASAIINVSAVLGGGTVNIGGSEHGAGPLPNAQTVTIDAGAQILADSLLSGDGGQVIVWSDQSTQVHGLISAQGGPEGGNGGFVETSGEYLDVSGAAVNLSASNGSTGTWLLDPTNIWIADNQTNATAAGMSGTDTSADTISGSTFLASGAVSDSLLTVSSLETALAAANVVVITLNPSGAGSGNITVVDPISWTSSNSLTLTAANKIFINASITATNGTLTLNAAAASTTVVTSSTASITSGSEGAPSGTGVTQAISVHDFNLVQGSWYQVSSSLPSFAVSNDFQIDSGALAPSDVQFIRATGGDGSSGTPFQLADIYGLAGINSNPGLLGTNTTDNFVLENNIDATVTQNWNSGTGFVPIGNNTNRFSGSLDGNDYVIDNLTIGDTTLEYAGLFGYVNSGGSIQNIGLTNISITSVENTNSAVGSLVGYLDSGSVSNAFASGSINQSSPNNCTNFCGVGGLIGYVYASTVSNSYSDVDIVLTSDTNAGGLIGALAASTVSSSFNLGSVSGQGGAIGGLIGSAGTLGLSVINDSYNIGAVSGNNTVAGEGGLVGYAGNLQINNSYAAGLVSGSTNVGGLVGIYMTLTVNNSFWDTQTSGQSSSAGGGTGATTANMMTATTFSGAGWTFDASHWGIIDGYSYPYLAAFYTSTPRVISGASSVGAGGTVTIAASGSNIASPSSLTNPSQTTATTAANGFYYFLEGNGVIADSTPIITYLSSNSANAVTVTPTSGGSITGLNLTANTMTIGDDRTQTISNTDLLTAIGSGSLTSNILYDKGAGTSDVEFITANISLSTTLGTTYNLDGNIATAGSGTVDINFNGPVILSAASAITTTNQAVDFASTLDGSYDLTIDAGTGAVSFDGIVGGSTPLTSLEVTGPTNINTTLISTAGAQTYHSDVTLGASPTVKSGSGAITFNGAVSGSAYDLTLQDAAATSTGAVTFNGDVSLNSLSTYGGSANYAVSLLGSGTNTITSATTFLNTNGVTLGGGGTFNFTNGLTSTASTTTLNGTVNATNAGITLGTTLLSGATFVNTTNQAINFSSSIDGAAALTVNAGTGTVTFNGAVGSGTALSSLSVTGPTNLNVSVTTTGAQVYNSAVSLVLGGTNTLMTTNQAVTFNSTLDGAENLTINAGTGTVTFGDAVGSSTALSSLSVTGPTDLNASITTTGTQVYNSAVTLGAVDTLTTTNQAITFYSTLDGGYGLTIDAGTGTVTFDGTVGSSTALAGLDVTGATNINTMLVSTSGAQTYHSNVTLSVSPTFKSSSGAINFDGTVSGSAYDLTLQDNTAASTGAVTFNGNVNLNSLITFGGSASYAVNFLGAGSSTITAATIFNNTNGVKFGNNGTFNFTNGIRSTASTTTLVATSGNSVTIHTTNGDIELGSVQFPASGGGTVVLNSGAAISLGDINGVGLSSLTTNAASGTTLNGDVSSIFALTMGGGGTDTINTASISTIDDQVYNDLVSLAANSSLQSSAGRVTFNATINGAYSLTLSSVTASALNAAVGDVTPLASLTLSGGGTDELNGGSIITTGDQTYNDNMTLGQNTTLKSTAGDVSFKSSGTVDGSSSYSLTINNVGTASVIDSTLSGLTAFTKDGTGTLTLKGANNSAAPINIVKGILVAENRTLGASTGSGSPVTVSDGATLKLLGVGTGADYNLALQVSGDFLFVAGYVGQTLTLNGSGVNGQGALTSACQAAPGACESGESWGGNVSLGTDTRIDTSDILLFSATGTIDGNSHNLTLAGSGVITLNSATTGINDFVSSLGSGLIIGNYSSNTSSSRDFSTAGSQTYNSLLIILQNTTLISSNTASNGNITIRGGVDGNYSGTLTIPSSLALTSSSPNATFTLYGASNATSFTSVLGVATTDAFDLGSITVTGVSGGNNTLSVPTSDSQQWVVSSGNAGYVTGFGGVNTYSGVATAEGFSFTRIANLVGGSSDVSFTFEGNGTLSGLSDAGTGGSSTVSKTLDYSRYGVSLGAIIPVTVTLNTLDAGLTQDSAGTVNHFANINDIIANSGTINLPSQQVSVNYTGPALGVIDGQTTFQGFSYVVVPAGIIDPIIFSTPTILSITAHTAIIDGQYVAFSNNFPNNAFFGFFFPVLSSIEKSNTLSTLDYSIQIAADASENGANEPLFRNNGIFSAALPIMEWIGGNIQSINDQEEQLDEKYKEAVEKTIKTRKVVKKVIEKTKGGSAMNAKQLP